MQSAIRLTAFREDSIASLADGSRSPSPLRGRDARGTRAKGEGVPSARRAQGVPRTYPWAEAILATLRLTLARPSRARFPRLSSGGGWVTRSWTTLSRRRESRGHPLPQGGGWAWWPSRFPPTLPSPARGEGSARSVSPARGARWRRCRAGGGGRCAASRPPPSRSIARPSRRCGRRRRAPSACCSENPARGA